MTNDERFLEEMFTFDGHLSTEAIGLQLVPGVSDVRVIIGGGEIHQLIDFKLHLEEKRGRNTVE